MIKGHILLLRTNTFVGKQIREMTDSYYNHVGMFISEKEIIEASMLGVKITPFSKFEELKSKGKLDYGIYKVKGVTNEQLEIMIDFLTEKLGFTYDFIQFISLLFFFIFKWNRKKEPVDVPNAFICSELMSGALDKAGLQFSENVDKDCITPGDIENSKILERIK